MTDKPKAAQGDALSSRAAALQAQIEDLMDAVVADTRANEQPLTTTDLTNLMASLSMLMATLEIMRRPEYALERAAAVAPASDAVN